MTAYAALAQDNANEPMSIGQTLPISCQLPLNIGVSLGTLFDMRAAKALRVAQGEHAYNNYMETYINKPFAPGPALATIKKLMSYNKHAQDPYVTLALLSRVPPQAAHRVRLSLYEHGLAVPSQKLINQGIFDHYGLDPMTMYAQNENCGLDLILSTRLDDVKLALNEGIPAGHVDPNFIVSGYTQKELTIGVDLDRAVFLALGHPRSKHFQVDNEEYTRKKGLKKAGMRERKNRLLPAHPGPIAPYFFKSIALRKIVNADSDSHNLNVHVITARTGIREVRAKETLNSWGCTYDKFFATGYGSKGKVAKAEQVDIFIDDGAHHLADCRKHSPETLAIHVPWTSAHINRIVGRGHHCSKTIAKTIANQLG